MLIKNAKLQKIYGFSKKHLVLLVILFKLKEIILCESSNELLGIINKSQLLNKSEIGFVPTMGALHEGHLQLVRRASEENELVIVSIFVNPTQFNNPEDLEKYPRTLDTDIQLLKQTANCIVFVPKQFDIYPKNDPYEPIDLVGLDQVMEGRFRPGHFQGVVHVVYNFFKLIKPCRAYFGKKDFQQLAIIKHMNRVAKFPVQIVECETIREQAGLAKSSRNLRLNENEKKEALIIYQTLLFIKEQKRNFSNPFELKQAAIEKFNGGKLKLEYLELVDSNTLQEISDLKSGNITCCIAAYCGEVRLIDNLAI
jgi:pantoate--beta-alanine ligase